MSTPPSDDGVEGPIAFLLLVGGTLAFREYQDRRDAKQAKLRTAYNHAVDPAAKKFDDEWEKLKLRAHAKTKMEEEDFEDWKKRRGRWAGTPFQQGQTKTMQERIADLDQRRRHVVETYQKYAEWWKTRP